MELCALMWKLLTWCNKQQIMLRARQVPGSLNVIAGGLTRSNQIQHTKWSLFQTNHSTLGTSANRLICNQSKCESLGTSANRLICNQSKCESSKLRVSHPRPASMGSGCNEHFLEEHSHIRLSSQSAPTQSGRTIAVPTLQAHPDSPRLGNKTVVLGSGGTVC